MDKNKFNILVIDPPYKFSDLITMDPNIKRGAQENYPTLDFEELLKLSIKEICADQALMALWVPASMLQDGLTLLKNYGFDQKQIYSWIKIKKNIDRKNCNLDDCLSFGMGRLFRSVAEYALIGVRGKIYDRLQNKSQRSIAFDINERHSKKTELLQSQLEIMFPRLDKEGNIVNSYLEIFARRKRENWVCLGNEIDGTDIRDSLKKLIEG